MGSTNLGWRHFEIVELENALWKETIILERRKAGAGARNHMDPLHFPARGLVTAFITFTCC